jgi:predicted phosphodiesterase
MRIALLSDIHGNLAALEAVVADVRRRGVDQIVCLGDNVSGPLLPLETAQYLMAAGWLTLAGNHERQLLALTPGKGGPSDVYARACLTGVELSWLQALPPHADLSAEVYLCHGTPRSDCEHFLESVQGGRLALASDAEIQQRLSGVASAVVACGHSHVPRSVRLASGQLLVNPGSVGLQAYIDDHPERYTVECATPDAQYAIVEKGSQGWVSMHHCVRYNAEPMAQLAAKRGRSDWENALRAGRI